MSEKDGPMPRMENEPTIEGTRGFLVAERTSYLVCVAPPGVASMALDPVGFLSLSDICWCVNLIDGCGTSTDFVKLKSA